MKPGRDELAEARLRRRQRELQKKVETAGGATAPTRSELNQMVGGLPLGRPPSKDPMKAVTVRLPSSVLAALTAMAEVKGLTVGAIVREAVKALLHRCR